MKATTRLLTIEDLAARWGVSEDAIRAHIRNDGLPYIPVGGGIKRPQYRFRESAIEAWEAGRERQHDRPADNAPTPPPPALAAIWDGKTRATSKRRGGKGG